MRGATYAFTSVVDTRSYSGARGMTSCDTEMCSTSGYSSSTSSRARSSWAGLVKLWRNITAIERQPSFFKRCTPARTASSSSGRTTLPSKSTRSGIGMRARRRAIGGGAGYDGSQISSLCTRRSSISSRWPSVTSRPVAAPSISIIVLSAVVVPCTSASSAAHSSAGAMSSVPASWASPFMTPSDWSSDVVGVLSSTSSPAGVTQMRSVKVPPTSTPTR